MRANGVPAVWLTPPQYASTKTIMWMHGGAFIFCHTGTHARLLSSLGAAADAKVLSVEYSLCPDEGRYADMLREVTRAYEWLVDADGGGADPKDVVVGGDSAGGHLALGLIAELAKKKREEEDGGGGARENQVRSIHWSPYDRVRVVNADP